MRLDCDSNSSFPVCPWLLEKLAPLSFFFTVVKFLPFSFHHSSGSQCVILPQSALTCPCSPPPGVFLCFEFLLEFFPTLKSVVNFRRPNLPASHWSFGVKEMILHVTNRMTSLIVLNLSLQFAEQPSPQTSGSKLHTEKIYHLMFKVKENFTFFKYIFCLFVGVLGVFEGKLGVTPAKTYKLHWFTQQRRDRGLKIGVCQRGKKLSDGEWEWKKASGKFSAPAGEEEFKLPARFQSLWSDSSIRFSRCALSPQAAVCKVVFFFF